MNPTFAQPIRPSSFVAADLYPETKGPMPSTSQLGNPHEVVAAARGGFGGSVLTGPPLSLAAFHHPATWALLGLGALFVLGMRR